MEDTRGQVDITALEREKLAQSDRSQLRGLAAASRDALATVASSARTQARDVRHLARDQARDVRHLAVDGARDLARRRQDPAAPARQDPAASTRQDPAAESPRWRFKRRWLLVPLLSTVAVGLVLLAGLLWLLHDAGAL